MEYIAVVLVNKQLFNIKQFTVDNLVGNKYDSRNIHLFSDNKYIKPSS